MVNKLDPDAMRPKGPSRKYALSQEELQDLSREIDLFIGDDLLKFEGTNLDDVVFGDAGDDLSLPHYLWSALFMKIHIGRAIKEHSRRSQ